MNWKGCGRKRAWPNLRNYPSICPRIATRGLSQDCRYPYRDSNRLPFEYKSELISTEPTFSALITQCGCVIYETRLPVEVLLGGQYIWTWKGNKTLHSRSDNSILTKKSKWIRRLREGDVCVCSSARARAHIVTFASILICHTHAHVMCLTSNAAIHIIAFTRNMEFWFRAVWREALPWKRTRSLPIGCLQFSFPFQEKWHTGLEKAVVSGCLSA
jgi:hypothetical protein